MRKLVLHKKNDLEECFNQELDSSFSASQYETETEDEIIEFKDTIFKKKSPNSGDVPLNQHQSSCFLVYWSSLLLLLNRCLTCSSPASITECITYGSALFVKLLCSKGHHNVWRSQPLISGYYHGNIKLAASVLFSSNTFTNLLKYFQLAGVEWISKSSYYEFQKKYLLGVANEAWEKEKTLLVNELAASHPPKARVCK